MPDVTSSCAIRKEQLHTHYSTIYHLTKEQLSSPDQKRQFALGFQLSAQCPLQDHRFDGLN